MTRRTLAEIAATIASVAFLTAIAIDQARTSARVAAIEAETADILAKLPKVTRFATNLPGWTFTILEAPDGTDMDFRLAGRDLPLPRFDLLPLPPRKPAQ